MSFFGNKFANNSGGSGEGGQANWATIINKPSTFPPAVHNHAIGDVTGLDARLTNIQTAIDDSKTMGKFEWRYDEVTQSLNLVVIE